MALNPNTASLLIASLPALVALVILLIALRVSANSSYRRALSQSRLELDLLRNSLQAEQERQEEGRQRILGDINHLRAEWQERYRSLQGQMDVLSKEGRSRQNPSAFDFRPGAFETLWSKVLKIREFVAPILAIYSLPSATTFLSVDESLGNLLPQNGEEDFRREANELQSGAEALRPFLGEDIWQIYSVYCAYVVKTAWKILDGKKRGQIPPWDKDCYGHEDVHALLGLVLTDEELQVAVGEHPQGAPLRILAALECMMLDAMNVWMFGAPLSHLGLRDREKIAETILPIIGPGLLAAKPSPAAEEIEPPAQAPLEETAAAPDIEMEAPEITDVLEIAEEQEPAELPEQIETPEHAVLAEEIELLEAGELPEQVELPDATELPEQQETPEQAVLSEEVELLEATELQEKAELPEQEEAPEQAEVPKQVELPEPEEVSEQAEAPEKTQLPEAEAETPEAEIPSSEDEVVTPDWADEPLPEIGEATVFLVPARGKLRKSINPRKKNRAVTRG